MGSNQLLLQSDMVRFYLQMGYKFYWFGNYWILLSTMQCSDDSVKVYDSAFHSHPKEVLLSIVKALVTDEKTLKVSIMDTEMQPTPNNCGIFAIAMMVTIAYGDEPCYSNYQHSVMHNHLSQCFEDKLLVPFSSSPSMKDKAERMVNSLVNGTSCHRMITVIWTAP